MTTLVIAELLQGKIQSATLNAVTAAQAFKAPVTLLIAGQACGEAAKAGAAIAGVTTIMVADDAGLKDGLAENLAPLAAVQAKNFKQVLAPSTAFGKNLLPRVAALLDMAMVSDVIAIESADTFQRPIYAGNAIATVHCAEPIKLLTVRSTAFAAAAAAAQGGNATITAISGATDTGQSRLVGRELSVSTRPDLATARIVVSGGRGVGSAENFKLIEALADKLAAAVGASRAAVDAGYVPNDYQVGQTGKVVAPDLYIAVGISGAAQHLAGMSNSKVIVAINKDPDAPIFGVADYGLVADLFTAVPELAKALGS